MQKINIHYYKKNNKITFLRNFFIINKKMLYSFFFNLCLSIQFLKILI